MQPILRVNLSTRVVEAFAIPQEWERSYLGGASLAARLLYDQLLPEIDPLSPAAALLFLNGPLSGTAGPATGRFVVAARSPATGLWGESNCGGFWGPELRRAGYDGLWITGRSPAPVCLVIMNGQVQIRPADHLWGLDTYSTQQAIQRELEPARPRVAVIGPAGEAQIPFSLILTDHGRVAGRTGLGAVMGAKNLKAIAVQGQGKIPVANPELYLPLRSEANRSLRVDAITQVLRSLGTAGAIDYFDYLGELPKRYFQDQVFEGTLEVSGTRIAETVLAGVSACQACVIACGRVVQLPAPVGGGPEVKRKGPEYETLAGFGPNLLIADLGFAVRMGELCDRYGMDSISLSNTLGLAFKLYEQGIITLADTGGLPLVWGDADAVEQCVHWTAARQGFGAALADGARGLGRRFGQEAEAVQVNGLEAAYHDPRGATGMALVYATSPRGACHNQSDYFNVEIGQVEASLGLKSYSRFGGAEKARNVAIHQDWRTVFNALVICIFANVAPEMVLGLVNAACGLQWELSELLQSGERAWNLKRVINHRLGLRGQDDAIPAAFLRPFSQGLEGAGSPLGEFEQIRAAYYAARGWDLASGVPRSEKLVELGLDWTSEELYRLSTARAPVSAG